MTMLTEKKFEQLSSCVCCMMKEDREGHCSFCLDLHAYYSTEKTMPKLPTLPDDLGSREGAEVFEAAGNVTDEPFPNSTLPTGRGYVLSPPDVEGDWSVRTYIFDPSQIVVYEGDQVTLNFLGVNAEVHNITVNGYAEPFELHRGELKTVTFTADRAGTIDLICSIHQPTMHGQIIVLPRG